MASDPIAPPDPCKQMAGAPRLLAGVELGGTKCVCILGYGPDKVLEVRRIPTRGAAETVSEIMACLTAWQERSPFAALGVASFGPLQLDPSAADHGSMLATPKQGWSGAPLLSWFRQLGVPVALDTDVTGAALAEGRWGGAKGLSSWAYVTVGTGVGAGVIVNGAPVQGFHHAEAGHMRIARFPDDTWPGNCPFHGDCVEGLISGPAIAARVGRNAEQLEDDHPVWDVVAHAMSVMAHNLILTAAAQRVILGGGVGSRAHLLNRVREGVSQSLNGYLAAGDLRTIVIPPALGGAAGPLGALAVAMRALA